MITRAFIIGIQQHMKCGNTSLLEAIKNEFYMMRKVMGFKMYVKYMNGIAVEGKDFITVED